MDGETKRVIDKSWQTALEEIETYFEVNASCFTGFKIQNMI